MVKHGIPTVTFGAGQNDIHTVDECVDLDEFDRAARWRWGWRRWGEFSTSNNGAIATRYGTWLILQRDRARAEGGLSCSTPPSNI